MPGNGGIVPDQNSFSVPVEMPVWEISTTMSSGPGASRATDPSAIAPGLLRITATVSIAVSPVSAPETLRCQGATVSLNLHSLLSTRLDAGSECQAVLRAVTTLVTKGRWARGNRTPSKPAAASSEAIRSGDRTCPVRIAMV